jgi:hypothetical protein
MLGLRSGAVRTVPDMKAEEPTREAVEVDTTVRSIQHMVRALIELAKTPHDPATYLGELDRLHIIASGRAFELCHGPFFEEVLAASSATAWVCAEETLALHASSFLRRNGKRVPDGIAVMGFDHWPENTEQQVTTYDFNMPGIVQRAMHMILDEKVLKSFPAISEVEGHVIERKTTRR